MPQRLAILLFLLTTAALVIGQRFDFGWAGGRGYDYSVPVTVLEAVSTVEVDRAGMTRQIRTNDTVARGEIVKTGEAARVLLNIEGLTIGLDERTDLKIEKLSEDIIQMRLIRGRMMIVNSKPNRELIIATKSTRAALGAGEFTLVNYDFREVMSLIPIHGQARVITGQNRELEIQEPVDIFEAAPWEITRIFFDAEQSAAADFYQWFEALSD